jgi:hypothetical protein
LDPDRELGLSRLVSASLLLGVVWILDVRSIVRPSPDATDTKYTKKQEEYTLESNEELSQELPVLGDKGRTG